MKKRIKFISGCDMFGNAVRARPTMAVRRLAYEAADKMEKATGIRPNVAVLPPHRVKK